MSGEYGSNDALLDKLEICLAGTMLFVEFNSQYERLWNHGLNRDTFNTLHLGAERPDSSGLGRRYMLARDSRNFPILARVSERKWSGRLLIRRFQIRLSMLFR